MITKQIYSALQEAYDHMNNELFGRRLTPVLMTFQRKKNSLGYYCPDRFETREDEKDNGPMDRCPEIALNPDTFRHRSDVEILSTLAHEMCHHFQHERGNPPARGSYHDKEWAGYMMNIGLQPTHDGTREGRMTGARMTHMIVPGGQFNRVAVDLISKGWKLEWEDSATEARMAARKVKEKIKYTCSGCGTNVWGKPNLKIMCGECGSEFQGAN